MSAPSYTWISFDPRGLQVSGSHSPVTLPVHSLLQASFNERLPTVREKVLATPGGFDGHRAVVYDWETGIGALALRTGYRSYCEGLALKQVLAAADPLGLPAPGMPRLRAPFAWGTSLRTLVLLPDNHVLANHRGAAMQVNPGVWTCFYSEIMEPSDVQPDMAPLLAHLVAEELPALVGLGSHRFVGLLHLAECNTTQLVSLLDLRDVPRGELTSALSALRPDLETQAFAAVPLEMAKVLGNADDQRLLVELGGCARC